MAISTTSLAETDRELIEAARTARERIYLDPHHTCVAAVRGGSGQIHLGPNVWVQIHGSCAEPVALGAAVLAGESNITTVVAIGGDRQGRVIPPCGNCRQLLFDYSSEITVIIERLGTLERVPIKDLLPAAYRNTDQLAA